MRNGIILAGAATLALALAGPALAQGKGNGGGGPKGGGGPAKAERGGGGGPKADRGGGREMRVAQPRGNGRQAREARVEQPRGNGRQAREARVEQVRGNGRQARDTRVEQVRGNGKVRTVEAREARGKPGRDRDVRVANRGSDRQVREVRDVQRSVPRETRIGRDAGTVLFAGPALASIARTGLVNGCPPGLAAKNNGCLPPGQAKRMVGAAVPAVLGSALLPPLYRSWYPDSDEYYYRAQDGYVYRIDRDRSVIDGFFPLNDEYTGGYYVGAAYPDDYLGYYNVPVQYQPWYNDGDDYYRYADGAIYQVDPQAGILEAIVSLLAGDLAVGQPLPAGYDVYNVPYDYRDRYADGPDAWYRYNDGYIYQVDPATRLVQAIVETLV